MPDDSKRAAGERSLAFIEPGMRVGLGTGSTAKFFIEALGAKVQQGFEVIGVPTSAAAAALATQVGIPLATFQEVQQLDVTVDGADEVGPELALIKGGGGALLHEKVVASASAKLVIVAGEGKYVPQLGKFPLPVEAIQFAGPLVQNALAELGANPVLRVGADGRPFETDEGNWIYDCYFGTIANPHETAAELRSIVGVVEHGLFLDMASVAIIAEGGEIKLIER